MKNIPRLEEINRELARRSFAEFVKQAWPIIEPNTELKWNWHIDAICSHLQAVHAGTIKDLIINIPFRLSKSILCSVMYPTWVWLTDPGHKFVCTSHTHKTVLENSIKMRRIVTSDWFKAFFPGNSFSLTKDTENYFINEFGGHRQSYSVETSVTGITANTLIIDDPMTSGTASSRLERDRVERVLENDFMTRLTPPGQGRRIIVMQRLHQEDTSGKYLRSDKWDRLIIPAIWDGDQRSKTALNFQDHRELGQSIFPDYMSDEYLEAIKVENGSTFFASQLQQRPVALEGSIIKHEWIKTFHNNLTPNILRYTISIDTAIKVGQNNDYSVVQLWGEAEDGYYLLDMYRKKLEYPALKTAVLSFCDKYQQASEIIIEDKASGQQLVQDFKQTTRLPVIPVIPTKDKAQRLHLVSGLFESGKVFVPDNVPWKIDFIDELCSFPYAVHDDIVDATTQYLSRAKFTRNRSNVRVL